MGHSLVFTALFLAAFCAREVAASTDVDYGEMYVLQSRTEDSKPWQGTVAYTYGFSNPYLGVHGVQAEFSRRLNEFFGVGISPSFYTATQKSVARDLERELGAQGISVDAYRPEYSTHVVASVIPLAGMLNWFSSTALNFDFAITAGAGVAKYRQTSGLAPSFRLGALPRVMLTSHLGFTAGVQASLERVTSSDWQNRIETLVGVTGRF